MAVEKDTINPDHYKNQCSLECIESMIIAFGEIGTFYFCICNAYKYLWRYKNKNGTEDLQKASWYVDKAEELALNDDNLIDVMLVKKVLTSKLGEN